MLILTVSFQDYAVLHCHVFCALCPISLQNPQLQSYSNTIVASVTYYKQHIFREKAVIVQKCGTNGFLTLLYAFLQCHPYTRPWKLSSIEVRLSSSIKATFAIELWCYTFSSPLPPPSMPCFIWVHNSNDLSNGSKMLFPLSKITVFVGHVEVTLRPIQLWALLFLPPFFCSLYSNGETILQCFTGPVILPGSKWYTKCKEKVGEKDRNAEKHRGGRERTKVNHRAFFLFENVKIKKRLFLQHGRWDGLWV